MRDIEFCNQILGLDGEWSVSEIDIDQPSNRIDITIIYGEPSRRGLFRRQRKEESSSNITLRHLSMFGMRCYLHVPEPAPENGFEAWNNSGSKLTLAMEEFLIHALENSKSLQGVSEITGLNLADIREVSERTGVMIERPQTAPKAEPVEESMEHGMTHSFDLAEMDDIPLESHPNWMKLIQGNLQLSSTAVGLRMLLQRIRQEVASNPTETTALAGIRLLRQYFIKNQATHRDDIEILNGRQRPSQPIASKPALEIIDGGVPAVGHPCWQQIISGDKAIDTRHVALQMMIERLKLSVEKSPDMNTRNSGAKILHQFFVKHKDRLAHELKQLSAKAEADPLDKTVEMPRMDITTTMPASVGVPPTNHECWQRLVDGRIDLQTSAVGLQMMLERVRQSIQRNPTMNNRAAGIKILHQYFLKHQTRHREEIQTLLGNIIQTNTADGHTNIPSEDHPNWQKLINGELEIVTDVVALKMMLERIRISVEKNPTEATRLAGAKILRQYFIKHQQKHRAELDRLVAA